MVASAYMNKRKQLQNAICEQWTNKTHLHDYKMGAQALLVCVLTTGHMHWGRHKEEANGRPKDHCITRVGGDDTDVRVQRIRKRTEIRR